MKLPRTSVFATLVAFVFVALPLSASAGFSAIEGNNNLDNFPDAPGAPLNFDGNPTVLVASEGLNVAFGQFRCQGSGCRDHYDSFRIQVPAGLQIALTEFSAGNLSGGANAGVPEELHIFPGPAGGTGILVDPQDAPAFITPPAYQDGSHLIRLFDFPDATDTPQTSTVVLGPGFYDVVSYNFNFVSTVDE